MKWKAIRRHPLVFGAVAVGVTFRGFMWLFEDSKTIMLKERIANYRVGRGFVRDDQSVAGQDPLLDLAACISRDP